SRAERGGVRVRDTSRCRLSVLRGEHQVSRQRLLARRQARGFVGLYGLRYRARRRTFIYRAAAKRDRARDARCGREARGGVSRPSDRARAVARDRKSTRLNSSHVKISYAVFCLKKKK